MNERDRAVHDALNALAVARAAIEAMIDGVLERTDERLRAVSDAISQAADELARRKE